MEYRALGKTNLKVSALGIGSWQLSGPVLIDGKADGFPDIGFNNAVDLIRACEDLGINLIDSAEIYGAGEGERRVGEALQGRRDRWIISTKFGWRQGETGERITDSSPGTIRTSLEGSLKRLQTDYVDIYLYHTPPEKAGIDAGREVLEALKQEGKIRFYGISTDDSAILRQLAEKEAVDVVMFNQSLLTHPSKILEIVKENNFGTMIRGALKSGLLSGKYFTQRPNLSSDDTRGNWMGRVKTEHYAVLESLIPEGASMTAIALRYLLDFDTTHTITLGGKTLADYQTAVRAFDLSPLTIEQRMLIEKLRQKLWRTKLKSKALALIGIR
jgi:aryl-alcohol dehydrogenase-like predicted oxidoreductase